MKDGAGIELIYVQTHKQIVDMLTKGLGYDLFRSLQDKLMGWNLHETCSCEPEEICEKCEKKTAKTEEEKSLKARKGVLEHKPIASNDPLSGAVQFEKELSEAERNKVPVSVSLEQRQRWQKGPRAKMVKEFQ